MRTEHLRALLKAAQLGSISKASRALHINQQQLSKTILALENDFGCKIFERSAKGIRPTAEGEDILATAERMLSDLDALTARLAQKAAQTPAAQLGGTLTIHTMVNIWPHSQLFEALDAFTSAYPAVKILYDELSPSQIIAAVVQHPEQIGSIVREQTNFGTTMTLPDTVTFLPLYKCRLTALAGADSDFAQRHQSTSLKALTKEPMVVYRPDVNAPPAIAYMFAPYGGFQLKYSVANLTAFYDLLRKGKAISVGIQKNPADLAAQQIVTIPIRDPIVLESGLIIHQSCLQDPLIRAFGDFYQEYCRTH